MSLRARMGEAISSLTRRNFSNDPSRLDGDTCTWRKCRCCEGFSPRNDINVMMFLHEECFKGLKAEGVLCSASSGCPSFEEGANEGLCQPPYSAMIASDSFGPQLPRWYGLDG